MLANQPKTKYSKLAEDHTTGYNHEVIQWAVETDTWEEADNEMVVGWYFTAIMGEDIGAAEIQLMERGKERAALDADCTAEEM